MKMGKRRRPRFRTHLVFMGTAVCVGAIEDEKSPTNPPKAPPTTKDMTPLKGHDSATLCIINSSLCWTLAMPADWGTMMLG